MTAKRVARLGFTSITSIVREQVEHLGVVGDTVRLALGDFSVGTADGLTTVTSVGVTAVSAFKGGSSDGREGREEGKGNSEAHCD